MHHVTPGDVNSIWQFEQQRADPTVGHRFNSDIPSPEMSLKIRKLTDRSFLAETPPHR